MSFEKHPVGPALPADQADRLVAQTGFDYFRRETPKNVKLRELTVLEQMYEYYTAA